MACCWQWYQKLAVTGLGSILTAELPIGGTDTGAHLACHAHRARLHGFFLYRLFNHRFPCVHLPCLALALYTVVATESWAWLEVLLNSYIYPHTRAHCVHMGPPIVPLPHPSQYCILPRLPYPQLMLLPSLAPKVLPPAPVNLGKAQQLRWPVPHPLGQQQKGAVGPSMLEGLWACVGTRGGLQEVAPGFPCGKGNDRTLRHLGELE